MKGIIACCLTTVPKIFKLMDIQLQLNIVQLVMFIVYQGLFKIFILKNYNLNTDALIVPQLIIVLRNLTTIVPGLALVLAE